MIGGGVRAAPERFDTALLVATLAASFNLRIALVGVGPVIEDIRADVGVSSAVAGLLTTVPIVCMGVLAFAGPPVIRRLGVKRTIAVSLVLIGAGTLTRAVMPSGWSLILATFPIGVGLALAGVALPILVKENFPERGGLVTGAYVASMTLASALFSFTVVPVSDFLGGWREALAASALAAAIALPIWLVAGKGAREETVPSAARTSDSVRLGIALALVFGLQAVPFSSMISWVAAIYRDAGWDPADAAITTGLIMLFGVPSAVAIPGLSDGRDRRLWIAGTAAFVAAGVLGVALAPEAAPLVWLVLFGLGNGALFPLVLTLPVDFGRAPAEVAELAVWTLGGGYLISAIGPVTVGALRDLSGGFVLPMTIVAAMAAGAGVFALTVLPPPGER
jgi:CP family cyanate transporter-like MFS transporter